MTSPKPGRLLPALLAAALAPVAAAALAAPAAAADQAPPPAGQHRGDDRCAEALQVLSSFHLLPNQPDMGRALCTIQVVSQQSSDAPQAGAQPETAQAHQSQLEQADAPQSQWTKPGTSGSTTDELTETHTTGTGRTTHELHVLGVPVAWTDGLTVHVPTLADGWHAYSAPRS